MSWFSVPSPQSSMTYSVELSWRRVELTLRYLEGTAEPVPRNKTFPGIPVFGVFLIASRT